MTLLFEPDVLPTGVSLDEARALAARTHELDRAHVFHSWSVRTWLADDDVSSVGHDSRLLLRSIVFGR
jgi:hypothetical protein